MKRYQKAFKKEIISKTEKDNFLLSIEKKAKSNGDESGEERREVHEKTKDK